MDLNRLYSVAEKMGYSPRPEYSKIVKQAEATFTQIAGQAGIGPQVVEIKNLGEGKYLLVTEGVGLPLAAMPNPHIYRERILELLERLHQLGIAHMDLSEENIIIQPQKDRVYIIDYGLSQWLEEIDFEEFFEHTDIEVSSLEDIKQAEIREIKWLLDDKVLNIGRSK